MAWKQGEREIECAEQLVQSIPKLKTQAFDPDWARKDRLVQKAVADHDLMRLRRALLLAMTRLPLLARHRTRLILAYMVKVDGPQPRRCDHPGPLGVERLIEGASRLVHVVTSTISVEFSELLEKQQAELGVGYVAAPVFGRPEVAEQAQLEVPAAGERAARDKARPLLDLIGSRIWLLGENPRERTPPRSPGTC